MLKSPYALLRIISCKNSLFANARNRRATGRGLLQPPRVSGGGVRALQAAQETALWLMFAGGFLAGAGAAAIIARLIFLHRGGF